MRWSNPGCEAEGKEVSGHKAKLDASIWGIQALKGLSTETTKERKRVPYSKMDKHSYIMTFGSQETGECSVSESRMRETRLSGLVGGILSCYLGCKEGCLP